MEIIIRKDEDEAALLVARLIAKALKEKPALVLGLATGRTMEKVYVQLARMHQDEGLDFSSCATFNLDEYVGIEPNNPSSYHSYMNKHLFSRVNIKQQNTHLPNGMTDDLNGECRQYELMITEHGGIDLQLLGIGSDGHIGFNEPLSALYSRTREKALTPETIAQNERLFPSPDLMPRRGITMGVGTILEAKSCLLLATGAQKAKVLAGATEGPITAMISASALQLHPSCRVIVDESAAGKLKGKDYYRWIFENEPEWQEFRDQ